MVVTVPVMVGTVTCDGGYSYEGVAVLVGTVLVMMGMVL